VVSEVVGTTAGVALDVFPRREVQVRGLRAPLAVRVIDNAAALGGGKFRSLPGEADQGVAQADLVPPTLAPTK